MRFTLMNSFSFLTIYKRPLLVIAALVAPFIALHFIASQGEIARDLAEKSAHKGADRHVSNDYPFLTLEYVQNVVAARVKQADALSEEAYDAMHKHNPKLPATLDAYRQQLHARQTQLVTMSEEQWQQEINSKIPPLVWSDTTQKGIHADTQTDNKFTPIPENTSLNTLPMKRPN